ncbi:Uncharacterized protein TCM_007053 [Theobroma cacao]|uniref:Uncharacterized protein n=1 Tax=Theobroma cacao TaxID=3641 RepID=A0A061E1Q0_THECC|nr:Uncharacterized protein TCM_007053 [Theobroma cacao]
MAIKFAEYQIAIRNQEKIDGWLTRIKDFKNSKNVQAYIITPTMDMKSKGKLSFDSHLSSQIKDICKCVDNKEELKSEIKSLKYEIEKLKGLLEYDKNNQQLKEKEKQQEYESLKCEMEKLKELLEYEKNNQQLKEKEKQQEYESLKCEIEKLKELLDEGDKKYLLDTASFALTLVNKEHLSYQIPNVKQKVRKNAIKKSRSKVCPQSPSVSLPYKLSDDLNDICNYVWNKHSNSEEKIVDFIDTYAIRSEMMTLEPRKWLDDTAAYFEKLFKGTLFASKETCWEIVVPNDVPRQSNSV